MKKFLIRGAVVLAAVYLFLCGLIYFVPQHLFYAPSSEPSDIEQARSANYPVERVDYRSADGTPLFAWYTKPANKNSKIVVFMHGNAYNIAGFYHKVQPFARRGWGTFLPEYRGFGGLPGEINQQNLEADAVAAVEYLHKLGYQNRDIVIYGMSLGSHMALNTAVYFQEKQPFAAVAVEVPFDTLPNVVADKVKVPMPLSFLMRGHLYDNLVLVSRINSPLLVMGGNADALIPIELAKNLYEHAKEPKKMIIYPYGTHNDLYNFRNYDDMMSWLEENEKGIK